VIAPTLHCSYKRATENTIVGERSVGDARLDYDALTYGWFDMFLKGEKQRLLDTLPKIRYYTMGSNKWQSTDTWPPEAQSACRSICRARRRQHAEWRRRADARSTVRRTSRTRSRTTHAPGDVARRQRVLSGQRLAGGALDQRRRRRARRARVHDASRSRKAWR
jgi:predicted acyl esterase